MATTAAGTPYVEASDLVAGYPAVSLSLANHIDGLDGGKVLQVVSVTKVDAFTTTSTSFTDVTGLAASITPSATDSTILVLAKIAVNPRGAAVGYIQLLRGATVIGGGTAAGSRPSAMSTFYTRDTIASTDLGVNFVDSPASVASQTYKIQARVSGFTLGINTSLEDNNDAVRSRTSSTITLMEIGA